MDVVSFNEISRVRPSVNRDSERMYGSIAFEIREAAVKPKNRPGPAGAPGRGHVNITPVITAVNFCQTLAPLNLG